MLVELLHSLSTMAEPSSKVHPRPRKGRRRPGSDQRFSSYLSFGFHASACLCGFLLVYALLIACLFPLLQQEAPTEIPTKRGQVLAPVVRNAVDKMKNHMPHAPGQVIAEKMIGGVRSKIKSKIDAMRKSQDLTDAALMNKAIRQFDEMRKNRQYRFIQSDIAQVAPAQVTPGKRSGFVVLGMHRSGTSMLSGLLVQGMGYNVGGPLIGGAADNEKGFFELIDAVLQNDEFMNLQGVWWAANVVNYDPEKALKAMKDGSATFKKGEKALRFLNDPKNAPWLQKDPRMCITLKTWLPLLNAEPAVVFTYRHPMEVSLSLKKREKNFSLEHGLRLWILYNMRGIQNSQALCRITSSNEKILGDPLHEVQRISDELTKHCGLPKPSSQITQDLVDKFVDPSLQHNKKQREAEDAAKEVIADYDGCKVHDYESDYPLGTPNHQRERSLYLKAMQIFCDFENGKAYEPGYVWPELNK